MEKAIRDNDTGVRTLIVELRSVMYPQMAAIREAAGVASPEVLPATDFDPKAASVAIAKLKALLEASDRDSADAVGELAAALAGRIEASRLRDLRACIEEFDFDGTQAKLTQVAAECCLNAG